MKDSWILAFLAGLGLCVMAAVVSQQWYRFSTGRNDFTPLYSGAYLLERGNLYDQADLLAVEDERAAFHSVEHGYIRLPFHAALLWPLSRLPYPWAYGIWQLASLAALGGFLALWRPPAFWELAVWTSMSFAVLHVWLKGQDVLFLLLVIAATAKLHESKHPFLAGLAFSLCAAKFHLFLLTPVLLLARRDWPLLRGLLTGGAGLAALSFAAAGPRWPLQFLESALNPSFSPGEANMPNLHGAVALLPFPWAWEMGGAALAVAAVWTVARHSDFRLGLAASLLGGLLLSRHSYLLDCAILLPACLTVMYEARNRACRVAAGLLLTPLSAAAIGVGAPYSSVVAATTLAVLVGWALERRSEAAPSLERTEAAPVAQRFAAGA